jgi:hypothetical protein
VKGKIKCHRQFKNSNACHEEVFGQGLFVLRNTYLLWELFVLAEGYCIGKKVVTLTASLLLLKTGGSAMSVTVQYMSQQGLI